jgi:hypothetical protein
METAKALKSGIIGAISLNLIHETARKLIPNAPHVDEIGMRALQRFVLTPLDFHPSRRHLRQMTLAGDLLSNSLYYALISGVSERQNSKAVWRRAWVLGLAAGLGAVVLPPLMRLGQQRTSNFPATASLTVAWYVFGALAAGLAATSDFHLASHRRLRAD